MTSSEKFSIGNESPPSRRTCGSAPNADMRVPWVMGVANSMVAGAKLIAPIVVGVLNWSRPENIGVGTRDSRDSMRCECSDLTLFEEKSVLKVMTTGI